MLNIKALALSLGTFLAVSFSLCVLGGLLFPTLPIRHVVLESILPGFRWISPSAFALGVVESFLFGAYAGLVFAPLHNFFSRRTAARQRSGLSVTKVA